MVGYEETLSCAVATLLTERDEENSDVAGKFVAKGLGVFPVLKGIAVTLPVMGWDVSTCVVSVFPLVG